MAAALAPLALGGCDRLLTPGFNTELQDVRAGDYVLDQDHAALLFKIDHLGFSKFVGRFNDFDASLDFDPERLGETRLEVIIDVASLDIDNEAFAEELTGSSWFDAATYPQAIYRTESCQESGDKLFRCEGELTLRGATGPVAMEVRFNGGGRNFLTRSYTLGFAATASFKRSDFGIDRFVNFGVGDDVELEIHVEFREPPDG